MCCHHEHKIAAFDRRNFLRGAASALGAASLGSFLTPGQVAAASLHSARPTPLSEPAPIPGGITIPPLLHVFLPGPPGLTLPFSGLALQGLNFEPSTIVDFKGRTALAYLAGTATGNAGYTQRSFNTVVDIRAFQGDYVALNGPQRSGTFALI